MKRKERSGLSFRAVLRTTRGRVGVDPSAAETAPSRRRRDHTARHLCLALLGLALLTGGGSKRPQVNDSMRQHAIAILRQPRFQAPPGWRWGSVVNGDRAHLRYGWADPAGKMRGVLLLAPSFQAPLEEYFETARDLTDHGFAVWIMDRRGQGGSDRWPGAAQRAHLEGGQREVRDLRQLALLARGHYPGTPLYLSGESLGGLLGLRLAR